MEDKRIKQISMEMFVAWSMICMGFFVFDQITVYSHHCPLHGGALLARNLIVYTCAPVLFVAYYALKPFFGFIGPITVYLLYLFLLILQIALFWYLGNLTGRFIVWIKHFRRKSPEEPAEVTDSQQETF